MPYTVKRGDSLSKIARELGIPWQELYEANKNVIGGDPNLIKPGQTFTVPGDSEYQSGASSTNSGGSVDQGSKEQDAGGGVTVSPRKPGVPTAEKEATEGVGIDDGDPNTPNLTILTGDEMKWYFDRSTGTWLVEYGLPNSDRTLVFEASPDQMDALFGPANRPTTYQNLSQGNLLARSGVTFGGNIAEMEGKGSFEAHVERVTNLALDEGRLPDWAKEDGVAMDIIFTAQSEGKSFDWTVDQLSKTQGFKTRFPQIEKFRQENNLSLTEAVSGFLEYEAGVKQAVQSVGQGISNVTPDMIGKLLDRGHSLKTIQTTTDEFRRMKRFAPAMGAFNEVLAANGQDPITDIQGMLDFVGGRSSAQVYEIYEASSIQEAALQAGLGDVFSVSDAINIERATNQTRESATAASRKAAELLLRLRHEVDVGKFDLDHDELIDISFGMAPRSGRSEAEVMENVNRAVLSAQSTLQKQSRPFQSFTDTGTPQAASLRNARQSS